jgi:hypothetical protein
MEFSTRERTYIMQKFLNFKDQVTRDKIGKIAGLMAMDADESSQADLMFAAVAYYMRNPDKIDSDLSSYMVSGFPDMDEGELPGPMTSRDSGVRDRKNRRKGES